MKLEKGLGLFTLVENDERSKTDSRSRLKLKGVSKANSYGMFRVLFAIIPTTSFFFRRTSVFGD